MCDKIENINIDFENIQSIKKGKVVLKNKAINIKYGYNGLGKSSIGKAIEYHINDSKEAFEFLRPYSNEDPKIKMSNTFKKCSAFNKSYIENWLFKENKNIIAESYSIFYKNYDLKKKEDIVNVLLDNLYKSLENTAINEFINKFGKITKNLKPKNDGLIHGNCAVAKGFKNGSSFIKKAEETYLKEYKNIINSSHLFQWLNWFDEGKKFVLDNECPYCLKELPDDFNVIQECVMGLIQGNDFKNNSIAKDIVMDIASITDISKRDDVKKINETTERLTNDEQKLLTNIFSTAKIEVTKLNELKEIKIISIENVDKEKMLEKFKTLKLDFKYFNSLDKKLSEAVKKINESIDEIILKIEELTDALKKYNDEILLATKNANNEINNFLKYAGIPYKFEIVAKGDKTSETIITPVIKPDVTLDNIEKHLSYGEFNAFSLALFGAISKRNDSDLIILDDPISSFDENKKFAVMHYLFNEIDGVLKDKTVLLLTHDMEPLLDIVRKDLVKCGKNFFATLLINDKGIISEKEIKKSNIRNSINQELKLAKNSKVDEYLRIIHLRRYYELTEYNDSDVYNVISNAEHLRVKPIYLNELDMPLENINNGIEKIKKHIPEFDYNSFISHYTYKEIFKLYKSSTNNYDKLRLIRPLLSEYGINCDPKLKNFITENYHVENMFLYSVYNIKQIPDYVITLCDELLPSIEEAMSVATK